MAPSLWQILIVVVVIMLLFGKGRMSTVMEDLAKGITAFKKGLKDEDKRPDVIEHRAAEDDKAESRKE